MQGENSVKDEAWVDAIEQTKRQQHWERVARERREEGAEGEEGEETHSVSMSDNLYRTMSDESLNDMKKKVLDEYKRRQDIRYEELVQRQLEETKQLKEKSMYMDFSDAEEEK